MESRLLIIVVLLLLSAATIGFGAVCEQAQTCQECFSIPIQPGCAWCSSPDIQNGDVRCFSPPAHGVSVDSVICSANTTENTTSSITLNELPLTSSNQITVSKATLKLRAGHSQSFQVKVRPAENFPLDLYMIVDLSFSLFDDLMTIKSISSDIAEAIRNISTRFQIGFGTFVDKLVSPYIAELTLKLPFTFLGNKSACRNDACSIPFSYVHNVNLTNISSNFINGFDKLEISTNADNPEGTLDAMAQAILCRDVVGWRENARKIIVVITDNTVHVAGDGIFAGIFTQAPSECKTVYDPSTNAYTYVDNTKYDYPSLEQIRTISKDNLVSPVFAVLENVRDYFESIAEVLSDVGAQVVTIQDGSANIIEALETAYENIVSTVRLAYSAGDSLLISYTVTCPIGTISSSDGMSCSGVITNDTVIFNVNVTLLNCTDEFINGSRVVNVIIPGYGRFEIEVEGICKCGCEETGFEVASPSCSGNGIFACGVCECDPGWTGDKCNCQIDEIDSLKCSVDDSGTECSGRGLCLCGECQCEVPHSAVDDRSSYMLYNITSSLGLSILYNTEPRVYGDTCECDNYRCPRNSTGFVCSGDHGNCTCEGDCECKSVEYGSFPFTGNDCSCNQAFCYNQSQPYTPGTEMCNGNGVCDPCNPREPCNCFAGFVRPYCTSSAQALRSCFRSGSFGRSCVKCIADNDDYESACSKCFSITLSSTYDKINQMIENDLPGSIMDTTRQCSFTTSDPICDYVYYIALGVNSTSNNPMQIIHVEPADCFPLLWWHMALIILVALLVLGIVLIIIIKAFFMILDYREVKNFRRSVAGTDLSKNMNPLYQSPEVRYENITFGKYL